MGVLPFFVLPRPPTVSRRGGAKPERRHANKQNNLILLSLSHSALALILSVGFTASEFHFGLNCLRDVTFLIRQIRC